MIAWAGTKDKGTFTIPDASIATGLQCTLNRQYSAEGTAYVDTDLDRLYHSIDTIGPLDFSYKYRTVYTLPLMKDTNAFRIVLQQITGGDVDVSKFVFDITDDNGFMAWDNAVLLDEGERWVDTYIYINSWKIVLQNSSL